MAEQWISTSWTGAGLVALSALVIYAAVIVYTRIAGLRSFSKMSAFDFASTVAIGSLMATVAVTEASLVNGLVGLGAFFLLQLLLAVARRQSKIHRLIDNDPVLLMRNGQYLEENLKRANVTERDVLGKLREANVTDPDQILAVVLETTGDVSVLHGDGPLHPGLLDGVRGAEHPAGP